jgi:hypothetical protein
MSQIFIRAAAQSSGEPHLHAEFGELFGDYIAGSEPSRVFCAGPQSTPPLLRGRSRLYVSARNRNRLGEQIGRRYRRAHAAALGFAAANIASIAATGTRSNRPIRTVGISPRSAA